MAKKRFKTNAQKISCTRSSSCTKWNCKEFLNY
jgi:hypothetical protein